MSLRIVPSKNQPSSVTATISGNGAPSIPAVHDTLRQGLAATSSELNSNHPLENRLKNWEATQEALKLEGLRRMYGLSEPIRREMEMKIASSDFRPQALGGPSNLHLDILRNKDCTIEWEDIYTGEFDEKPDFHTELDQMITLADVRK